MLRSSALATLEPHGVTQLLDASRGGDEEAWSALVRQVYGELQRLAHRQRGEHAVPVTLGTTGLVHECYLRLAGGARDRIENRRHFFGLASRVMRQVLCDYARASLRVKRGGLQQREDIDDWDAEERSEAEDLVYIDELLTQLETKNAAWARVVECRYFAGLGDEETAEALGIPLRTAQRHWSDARTWLAGRMS
jgi:RNA polymerase sigma factor (TIGR02999 family)